MPPLSRKQLVPLCVNTLLFLCAAVGVLAVMQGINPVWETGRYRLKSQQDWTAFEMPLRAESGDEEFEVELEATVGRLSAHIYNVFVDDCLLELSINSKKYQGQEFPLCLEHKGHRINVTGYVHPGKNTLRFVMRNYGGPLQLQISASKSDPVMLILYCTFLTVIIVYVHACYRDGKPRLEDMWLAVLFVSGTMLRLVYYIGTPYTLRGYDTDGHLEYIEHFRQYFSVPSYTEGWSFYHPPLYYFIGGLWSRFSHMLGQDKLLLINDFQLFAFIISILALGIFFWIAYQLYPDKKNSLQRKLFISATAVLPGVVYFSSRISNDVLVQFWVFLFFAVFLVWWQKGSLTAWIMSMVILSLGILTKTNAALLIPPVYLCLLFRPAMRWKEKIRFGVISVAVLALLVGWFAFQRIQEGQPNIVGNAKGLNHILLLREGMEFMFEFNPARIVLKPYNDPWMDVPERGYFFEYLFKSAFAGEFNFGPAIQYLLSVLLGVAIVLSIFALPGMWRACRNWERDLPIVSAFISVLFVHFMARVFIPYAPTQDFRVSFFLLVPWTYFVLQGIGGMPRKIQYVLHGIFLLYIALCAALIVAVAHV